MDISRSLAHAIASVLHKNAAVAADADSGSSVDLLEYDGVGIVAINIGDPTAGTNPTMDVTVVSCDTSGGTYAAVSPAIAFDQVGATGGVQYKPIDVSACKRFLKVHFDIGGTSNPSFPCSATFIGHKKGS